MTKAFKYFLSCALITATVASAMAARKSSAPATPSDADIDKASYVYLEALRQNALGNEGAAYELMKHAYAIDTTNTAIAYFLGYSNILNENATLQDAIDGAGLMKKHFDKRPEDYYESYTYGRVVSSLGQRDEAMRVWNTLAKLFPYNVDVLGERADSYARNGEFRKAIEAYDTVEAVMGQNTEISLRKLTFYYELADTTGLLLEARKLLSTAPNNAEFNMLMGSAMNSIGLGDSALHYFDRAIEIAPDDGRPYMSKARYYLANGDSASYERQINHALLSNGLDVETKVEVLTGYIQQYFASQDSTDRVNRLFEVLIDQHPHEAAIHELYSEYFIATRDYPHAAEQLQYVLDIDPSGTDDWERLIMVNLMADSIAAAIDASERALEYNPDNFELYQYIGPAYYQMKEYDKALELYNRCLDKTTDADHELRGKIYGGMGDVYYSLGDTLNAFASYEHSLKLNPGDISIMNNYAYFLAEEGVGLDKAERMSALAVKGAPENPTFLDTYAWVFFKKGEYMLALIYIEYAIKNSDTPSYELWDHYGDILFMNGDFDKAVECWEKAGELNPESELIQKKVTHKTYFYK